MHSFWFDIHYWKKCWEFSVVHNTHILFCVIIHNTHIYMYIYIYTYILLRLIKQPSKWPFFFSDSETESAYEDKLALKSQFYCLGCLRGETIVLYHHAELVISFFLFRWMFPSFSSFSVHGLYEFRYNNNTFKAMIWCCRVEGYNPSSVLH